MGKLGGLAKKAGVAVAAGLGAAGAGAVALGVKATGLASDLEQSIGAIDTVFKDSAGQMHEWAAGAAGAVGLTKNEFNELGTLIGTQLKNGGTAMEELAPKTNNLITLGADLASMFGGTTADAVGALSSALKGERDPIERYGVSLTQAAIDAKAAELGFKKVGGALSAEASQAATLALIMDQTADAHGNFAKESDTFAGQTERLKAEFENLTTSIGMELLPTLTDIATWVNTDGLPAIKDFGAGAKQLWDILFKGDFTGGPLEEDSKIVDIAFKLRDALIEIGGIAEQAFNILFKGDFTSGPLSEDSPAVDALFKLRDGATAVIDAFKSAWDTLSPIVSDIAGAISNAFGESEGGASGTFTKLMSVVGAALSFIGGQIKMWLTVISVLWDTFGPAILAVIEVAFTAIQRIVEGAMTFVQGIVDAVMAAIRGDWDGAWEAIKGALAGAWQAMTAVITAAGDRMKGVLTAAWESIKATVARAWDSITSSISAGVNKAIDWVKSLPQRAQDALSGLGSTLTNAGSRLIDGFIDGIKAGFDKVKRKLGELTNLLPDWKGPATRDANILKGAGRLVIGGFIAGMESQYGAVQSSLAGLTGDVASTRFEPPQAPATAGQGALHGQGGQATAFNLYDSDGVLLARLKGVAQDVATNLFLSEARELRAGAR
jgi:hypothetical protein